MKFKTVAEEPVWASRVSGEITDGDIWVPINKDTNSLTIKVSSGNFNGYLDLQLSDKNEICRDRKN